MASPQIEDGYTRVANELIEALYASDSLHVRERILLWVTRHTYGVWNKKEKRSRLTCRFTWFKIAEELGARRDRVSEAGRFLIAAKILRVDAHGDIGIQKDHEMWARMTETGPQKRAPQNRVKTPVSGGRSLPVRGGATTRESAHYRNVVERDRKGGASAPNDPALLPNGLPDTLRNRAELGHPDYPPDNHRGWDSADFKSRTQQQLDWDIAQRQRENDERAAYARVAGEKIAREMAAYDAAEAAMTDEQRKQRADKHAAAMRALREKRWPK